MLKPTINYQYLKVKKEVSEYYGERYFKCSQQSDSVVQICVSAGESRRGKANNFGIYIIQRLTLMSNYMAFSRLESCTKKEWDKVFKNVVEALS